MNKDDLREKLIELLRDAVIKSQDICLSYGDWGCGDCPYQKEDTKGCRYAIMVDLLITNGVTVSVTGEWEWMLIPRSDGTLERKAVCSKCGVLNKQYAPPYCPHCGADMKGGKS